MSTCVQRDLFVMWECSWLWQRGTSGRGCSESYRTRSSGNGAALLNLTERTNAITVACVNWSDATTHPHGIHILIAIKVKYRMLVAKVNRAGICCLKFCEIRKRVIRVRSNWKRRLSLAEQCLIFINWSVPTSVVRIADLRQIQELEAIPQPVLHPRLEILYFFV